MMRSLYITAMGLTVLFFILVVYFANEVHAARMENLFRSFGSDSYYDFMSDRRDADITFNAGLVSLFYLLVILFTQIMTLVKLRTTTMLVLTIIGLVFSVIMLAWDALMMSSPTHISFDEVGVAFLGYGLIILSFSIVGTVHAFRKKA